MAEPPWSQYDQAFKRIWEKLDALTKALDSIAQDVLRIKAIDLDIRDLTASDIVTVVQAAAANLKATVTQAEKDRIITSLPKKGTPTRINVTASGQIIPAPAANNHLEMRMLVLSVDADEIVRLRWGGATGNIICMLPTKGIIAMNLINVDEKGVGGATPQNLYLEKTGSGNCQGTVWTETVAD